MFVSGIVIQFCQAVEWLVTYHHYDCYTLAAYTRHTHTYRGWNVKRAFFISLCHCVYCIMCTCMYDVYFEYSFFYCSFIFIVAHSNANAWNIRFYHVTHSAEFIVCGIILRVYMPSHIHRIFRPISKQNDSNHAHTFCRKMKRNASSHSDSVAFYWLLKRIERSERTVKNETCFISFRSFFEYSNTNTKLLCLVLKVVSRVLAVGRRVYRCF